jgi:hypothetical protein
MLRVNPILLLVVTASLWSAGQAHQLSSCPGQCVCNESITCSQVNATNFASLLEDLGAASGGSVLNRVVIQKCATPLGQIDSLPKTFRTRSLDILECGVTGIGDGAFNSTADELVELRLKSNNLSVVPNMHKLRRLEVLNLNNNLVGFPSLL